MLKRRKFGLLTQSAMKFCLNINFLLAEDLSSTAKIIRFSHCIISFFVCLPQTHTQVGYLAYNMGDVHINPTLKKVYEWDSNDSLKSKKTFPFLNFDQVLIPARNRQSSPLRERTQHNPHFKFSLTRFLCNYVFRPKREPNPTLTYVAY